MILTLVLSSERRMGLGWAGGCRGCVAKLGAEIIPSLAGISYVFASLRAGLTEGLQADHQLLFFFSFGKSEESATFTLLN